MKKKQNEIIKQLSVFTFYRSVNKKKKKTRDPLDNAYGRQTDMVVLPICHSLM